MQTDSSHDFPERNYPVDLDVYDLEVSRLKRWQTFLAGFLLPTVILTGILGGLWLRLKSQQNDLESQIQLLQASKPGVNQIQDLRTEVNQLNQQVKTLNQQVPQNIASQLPAIQTKLTELDSRISEVSSQAGGVTEQQLNQAIQQALQSQSQPPQPSPSP